MRFWPMRRRATPPTQPSDDLILMGDVLRRNVDDILTVSDNGERSGVFLFRGQLATTPTRALDILRERFARFGYTPYMSTDRGGVLVQAWPGAPRADRSRPIVNVVLFLLTLVSVLWAGTGYVGSPTFDALRFGPSWWWMLSGVPFAVTLLGTLSFHEFGHYFAARYYRVPVSLPYFLPAPLLFGTFGAVIRMRGPANNRNALFDIAAAGPLAGLIIALPALVMGVHWSALAPASVGEIGRAHV